ncbi:serine hydrolase domain-containing protein [Lewinella sp. LCG006]|uniref:serine hydrolase domain-containing protein n=1 Tax=Lewinella sp. LCG006 TaxID=3231911 RepID=UPI00345FFFDA
MRQKIYSRLMIAQVFVVLFMLFHLSLSAQLPNNDLEAYDRARTGLVVLKNESKTLPLNDLDTLRPVLLSIGIEEDKELYNTLNAYTPTGKLIWQTKGPWRVEWPQPIKPTTVGNVFIIAMDVDGAAESGFDFSRLLFSSEVPVVFLLFGKGELVEALMDSNISSGILSEERGPWAQSLAAQLIFGGIGVDNRTKEALSEHIPKGSGELLMANGRMTFSPPALLEMDAQLLADSISAIINDGLAHHAFPGAQVLVAREGTVVYHEVFGYHTDAKEQPVQRTDLYDLASVSKITSALPALMKWYGEGAFDLDAPLQAYYPAARRSNKADLDFRTMLSHQARLRPWIPYWQGTLRGNGKYPWSKARDPERINDYRFRRKTLARDSSDRFPLYLTNQLWQHSHYRDQMMKAILKSPLEEEAKYLYSGLLFYLLPDIITMKAGVPYEEYLQNTFYRPLGAYTLGFNPSRYFSKDRIIPTERDSFFRMELLHGYVHDEGAAMMGGVSANAGLFANAYDLAKIMQMYLDGGSYAGQRFIEQSALDTFTNRHFAAEGNHRGLGFDKPLLAYDAEKSSVAEAASNASFGHAGYTGTFVWADPETKLLFIFLSNRVYPTRKNRGLYTGNIRPRIHTAIYQSLRE